MDVKGSTATAKNASYMTLVYHNLVYMVMFKLVTTKDSMITPAFVTKLAAAKTSEQLDDLVLEIMDTQFPSFTKNNWNIPNLEQMEKEVIHLTTDWNDQNVRLTTIIVNLFLTGYLDCISCYGSKVGFQLRSHGQRR